MAKRKPEFGADTSRAGADTPVGWVYKSERPDAPTPATPESVPQEPLTGRAVDATGIIERHAGYAAAAGLLLPLPTLDIAAIAAVEYRMLSELSRAYDVPFEEERARAILASLIGAYASTKLGHGIGASALRWVPIVGQVLGAVAVPAYGAALTWAIGRLFVQHFERGGTLADMDLTAARASLRA